MTLLVPLVFGGIAMVSSRWPSPQGVRESLIRAALLLGAIVTIATELLSAIDEIKASNVIVLWLVLGLAVAIAVIASRSGSSQAAEATWSARLRDIPRLPAAACATILGATLVVAIVAPPNYADALSYHMGRVAHWIQAGSLDYYPTRIVRQNYQMPFAEYVILHLQLLSGGDRWANLVQWASFALSGVAISLILAELGQPLRVQWAGALVAFTIPMAILEASGAQNDLVVSLWLLAFLHYLWRGLSDRSLESALLCGLALGLALATKGTAYLYAPPMGGVLVLAWLARAPRGRRLPPASCVAAACLVAACLNLGPWSRSQAYYGKPICCGEGYFMDRLTPGYAASNVVWNVGLHLAVPKLLGVVEKGIDVLSPVDLYDPPPDFGDRPFGVWFSYNEGAAGNTLHLLAVVAAAIVVVVDRRVRRGPAKTWLLAAVAGFLAFSLAIHWQPWGSRLHTPTFLAASIPVAIAIGSRGRWLAGGVLAVLFAGSLPYVFLNQQRPLLPILQPSILTQPRADQYIPEFPESSAAYQRAAEFVRVSVEPEIGLFLRETDFEYVLWALGKEDFAGPPVLRHVGVEPRPGEGPPPPPPEIVITSRSGESHIIDGVEYLRVHDFDKLSVLRRAAP
ncbi:MAG TPA: glycosyltransferase family 39 protein [Gemmatimonadota bacterium]|nr:glycosyltransferase family 39 protein [Gemmatimonadota bacterium]